MKTVFQIISISLNQIIRGIAIVALFLSYGCSSQPEIQFPVKVGEKPESITKGFNENYYVTVMNGSENGDGEVVEISENGVNVFAKGFDQPKGIVYLKGHLYFSDVTKVYKVDKEGNVSVFINKEDFPKEVL